MSSTTYTRKATFEKVDLEARSVPVVLATDAPVQRSGYLEVLDLARADLSRGDLPLIESHDQSRLNIGVVRNIRVDGNKLRGVAVFGMSARADEVLADVEAGIVTGVSIGYLLLDDGEPITLAGGARALKFAFQPIEASAVAIPADAGAGFYRSQPLSSDATIMTTTATPARDEAAINDLCTRHGVQDIAPALIRAGNSVDQARAAVLEELARRDRASGGHLNLRSQQPASNERETLINTLVRRLGGNPTGDTLGLADCATLAVRAMELSGQRVGTGEGRDRIIQRALGTTDFPSLLGTAVGRVLKDSYDAAPAALKAVAKMVLVPDFRARSVVRLSDAPDLLQVNEHGEFKHGALADAANGWSLTTFGRIVSLTRQALVNDDLDAFATLLTKFGQAAARREADQLTTVLTAPPNVDGAALFSAGRNSIITGAGSALQLSALGDAVKSLRKQSDMAGGGLVVQEPSALVVPAALEMTARQLVAQFAPVTAGTVQPWPLSVVVEPRLDAVSATAWYLVAGNQTSLEYGYLDGAQGVQTFMEEGFAVDGVEIKARLDFGCGWSAPVGWVKSNGA